MTERYIGLSRSSAAVLSSLSVGTWELDLATGSIRGDAIFARLYGIEADEAERGITLDRFAAAFHPEDRAQIVSRQKAAIEAGGLFVTEHRTVVVPGVVRWVLTRGQFERDMDGRVTGSRGICLDVTDSRADGHMAGQVQVRIPDATPPLDEFAERALGLWDLAEDLDAATAARLRQRLRGVLEEVGLLIAGAVSDEKRRPPTQPTGLH